MRKETTCRRLNVDTALIEAAKSLLNEQEETLQYKARVFALLGNDVRLKIMMAFLEFEKMCVCDLSDVLGMKQSPISQHLRKLKDAELLQSKREGMTIFYSIPAMHKERLASIIKG